MSTPTPRRVESSVDGPLTGPALATHLVTVWLLNDGAFYVGASDFAAEDETGGALKAYVTGWLYPSAPLTKVSRDTAHNLKNVASGFTRADFDGIDWTAVRDELLSE